MLQRLWRVLRVPRWDWIIMWRAVRGSESTFDSAPTEVVGRWAREEPSRFDGYPEIQDAIGYAQAELSARRDRTGASPSPYRAGSVNYSRCG